MNQLPSYEKIIEMLEKEKKYPFIDFDEFVGGTPLGDGNMPIIDKLFDEGYPVGFGSQSPESFKFRVYRKGEIPPSSIQLIIGKKS